MRYRNKKYAPIMLLVVECYAIFLHSAESDDALGASKNSSNRATSSSLPSSMSWKEGVTPADQADNTARGNWLKKLKYFRSAELVYKKNEADVEALEGVFKKFHEAYRNSLSAHATAVRQLGIQADDLHFIEEHYRELTTSPKGTALAALWTNLDIGALCMQIYEAFKDAQALTKLVENALASAERQMVVVRPYVEISWQKYVAIDSTYNDVIAKMLLDEMQAMNDHLNALEEHISRELDRYCRERIALLKEQVRIIEQTRNTLRAQQFPTTMEEFNKIKKSQEEQSQPTLPKKGFWSQVWDVITSPVMWLWHKIT